MWRGGEFPRGVDGSMETPGAGCPCGCKRRALGRLQRHGPGPQSAARPGNFQKLPGPERRATGSGPRLSAEARRSRGGRLAAALRFPEAWAGRWDARPRRGAGAARGASWATVGRVFRLLGQAGRLRSENPQRNLAAAGGTIQFRGTEALGLRVAGGV